MDGSFSPLSPLATTPADPRRARQLELVTRALALIAAAFDATSGEHIEQLAQALRVIVWNTLEEGKLEGAVVADALGAIALIERVTLNTVESVPCSRNMRAATAAYAWIEARPSSPAMRLALGVLGDTSGGFASHVREFIDATGISPALTISLFGYLGASWSPELAEIEAELIRIEHPDDAEAVLDARARSEENAA